jgi:hypothetical protein
MLIYIYCCTVCGIVCVRLNNPGLRADKLGGVSVDPATIAQGIQVHTLAIACIWFGLSQAGDMCMLGGLLMRASAVSQYPNAIVVRIAARCREFDEE